MNKLFCLINLHKKHWVLAFMDMTKQIIVYDSLQWDTRLCAENLLRYLKDEHAAKKAEWNFLKAGRWPGLILSHSCIKRTVSRCLGTWNVQWTIFRILWRPHSSHILHPQPFYSTRLRLWYFHLHVCGFHFAWHEFGFLTDAFENILRTHCPIDPRGC